MGRHRVCRDPLSYDYATIVDVLSLPKMVMLWRHNERARAPLRFEQLGSSLLDDPEALRIYAALFEKMLPSRRRWPRRGRCDSRLPRLNDGEMPAARSLPKLWLAVAVLSNKPLDDYDECNEGDQPKHIDHGNASPLMIALQLQDDSRSDSLDEPIRSACRNA